jgi:hypothetical protein
MLQNIGRQALTPKKYFLPHISVLTENVSGISRLLQTTLITDTRTLELAVKIHLCAIIHQNMSVENLFPLFHSY